MSFKSWLNAIVGGSKGRNYRRVYIKEITKELWSFILRKGYMWNISESHLKNCIATGLYENSQKSHIASEWNYSDVNTEYSTEDLLHYHDVIDWEEFWQGSTIWDDISTEFFRGQDRRSDIESFVWKQLNLQASPQTEELYEILLGGEEEAPVIQGDVYLQEAVEYNGWGGIRR
jgi:hypothetical protein